MGVPLGTSITPSEVAHVTDVPPGGAAAVSSGTAMARSDDVLVSAVLKAVNQRVAIHTAKLAVMTTAVQSGRYQVNAVATSRALVEDALHWSRLT